MNDEAEKEVASQVLENNVTRVWIWDFILRRLGSHLSVLKHTGGII